MIFSSSDDLFLIFFSSEDLEKACVGGEDNSLPGYRNPSEEGEFWVKMAKEDKDKDKDKDKEKDKDKDKDKNKD